MASSFKQSALGVLDTACREDELPAVLVVGDDHDRPGAACGCQHGETGREGPHQDQAAESLRDVSHGDVERRRGGDRKPSIEIGFAGRVGEHEQSVPARGLPPAEAPADATSACGPVSAKVTGHPLQIEGRATELEQPKPRRDGDPDRASTASQLRHDVRAGRLARRA